MRPLRQLLQHRLRFGLLAALLATTFAGLFAVARGQGQICKDFDNITVCGDRDSHIGSLEGNLRIGAKGQPPFIRVTSYPSESAAEPDPEASFMPLSNGRAVVWGSIELINAPKPLPLAQSFLRLFPGKEEPVEGAFVVDTINMIVANDKLGAEIPNLRNELYKFPFIELMGLKTLTQSISAEEFNQIEIRFLLKEREFRAEVPAYMELPLIDSQSGKTRVTLLAGTRDDGAVAISVKDFKIKLMGMIGDLKSIKLVPPSPQRLADASQKAPSESVQFEAELLEFSRADNPGLPNLDASNQSLVFGLRGVQFKDGRFKLRGGSVGIPDWSFGSAFKLTNQQAGIIVNDQLKTTQLVISSTLTFPMGSVGADARAFPMSIRVAGRELPNGGSTAAMTGTLLTAARPALTFGPLSVSTPTKTELVLDPSQNFFGLKAEQVTLRWNATMGGGSGVQTGFKLGMDKDRKLVFGLGAGGAINLPEVRNKAFTLQLSAGVTSANDRVIFIATGKARLALPGNGGVEPGVTMFIRSGKDIRDTCVGAPVGCLKRFEYSLSSFELSLGGFGIGLTNAKGTDDGGFAVEKATLKVPLGIKSVGGSISGFKVTGNGDVSITGGSVELPPMQVGSFSLVGVKGTFVKNVAGYEFKGAGTVPLPGLDPSGGPAGKKISGEVTVRTRFDASFAGFGVAVEFNTGSPGIPIGSTGMELVALRGSFDVNASTLKIGVGLRAGTILKVATIPAATVDANAQLQLNPFQLTANAKLSVLLLQVAEASVGIGHQQGFAGGPGFNVSFDVNFILAHGQTKLRVGPVTLSTGERKTVIAAEASYTLGIKRGAIGPLMPPGDITVAELTFKGGTFTVKGKSETLGLLGRVRVPIPIPFVPDPSVSVFVDLKDKRVDVTDTDDYKLIGATALRAQAARGVAGYSSRALSPAEAQGLSLALAQAALQETLPVELGRPGLAVIGISYPAASAPALRLRLPDGTELSEGNAAAHKATFLRYTDAVTEPHELAFVLAEAPAGAYSLIIDGAPAAYTTVSYMLNDQPAVSDVAVSCGGPAPAGVTVTCDGAAAGGEATVRWAMQDADNADATVSVGYAPLGADGNVDLLQLTPLAEGLPQGQGSFTWSLGEVPTGQYRLVVSALDGKNAPVEVVAAATIGVDDKRAPAAPQGLKAEALPGELLVTWQPGAERDLAGYEIGFGVVQPGAADGPAAFVYSRDMGAKQVVITASGVLDARLWGLEDDQEVFVGIRAYDLSGNKGEWSPLLRARPWALAPEAWTPAPGGALAMTGAVEVAFASPLSLDLAQPVPAELLTLRRADGTAVAGRLEALLNVEGDAAVGLRFVPDAALRGGERYTAVVKGGAGGIASADGRRMAQDYAWSFVAQNQSVFLPLVGR